MRQLFILLSTMMALHTSAQITPLIEESFKNTFTVPSGSTYVGLSSEVDSFPGWTFDNCYAVQYDDDKDGVEDVWLQIGSREETGSLITPPLYGLSGNARIMVQAYGRDDDTRVCIGRSGIEGELGWQNLTVKKTWIRLNPVLLKDSSDTRRIQFTCEAQKGASGIKRIFLANVQVCDMGDCIYYETFDRNTATGGDDGNFTLSGDPSLIKEKKLDYISSSVEKVYEANGCIAFGDTARFITDVIPATGHLKLLFRVAGMEDKAANMQLFFTGYKDSVSISSVPSGKWQERQIDIKDAKDSTCITFKATNCFLDDVRVKLASTRVDSLKETDESTAALDEAKDSVVDLKMTRTLQKDIWNTLCLPFNFDVPMLRFLYPDAVIEVMRLDSVENGVFTFAPAQYVPAGEPFLLKIDRQVDNPIFRNVIIRKTEPKTILSADGRYEFAGALSKTTLNTDGTHLFLNTAGELRKPSTSGNTLKGMRAYFIVPGGSARVSFMDEESPTAIRSIDTKRTSDEYYNLWGQRVTSGRGLLIKNGKKIFVK